MNIPFSWNAGVPILAAKIKSMTQQDEKTGKGTEIKYICRKSFFTNEFIRK